MTDTARDNRLIFPSFRADICDLKLDELRQALGAIRTPEALTVIWAEVQRQLLFDQLEDEGLLKASNRDRLGESWTRFFIALRDGTIVPEDYFLALEGRPEGEKQGLYFFLVQAAQSAQALRWLRQEWPTGANDVETFIFDRTLKSATDVVAGCFQNREAATTWMTEKTFRDWRSFEIKRKG